MNRITILGSSLEAVAGIPDGATVLIGGFGPAGQPVQLIEALLQGGATELTVICNNAGNGDRGLAALIRAGRVRKIVCSFPRQPDSWHFDTAYRAGQIELELVPQGNLAERIRAAGAGIGAFYTPTGFVGIGLPTKVSNHLPPGAGVMLHTENGMLGMGPEAHGDQIDPDLVNAAKVPVTELAGASYFHHADSFAMMRGGHLDICVLGAYQVSAKGDLANWHTSRPGDIPAVGGAMDLAIGARQTFVMMNLLSRDGYPRLVPECTYPLTGLACVTRVYTNLAVFGIQPDGVVVRDLFGIGFEELAALLSVPLTDATQQAAR